MKTRLTFILCLACALSLAACSPRGKSKSKGEEETVFGTLVSPASLGQLPHRATPEVIDYFKNIETSTDPSFAYTSDRPVCIFDGDIRSSINKAYYYIANLCNSKGNYMDYLGRFSMLNPNYKDGKGKSKAPMLDVYSYANGTDTLRIYVNVYEKGELFIPAGLTFAGE